MWRRRLLAWEEETVTECSFLLRDIVLQDHIADRWWWILDPIDGYSIKAMYHYLTRPDVIVEPSISAAAWLKQVPLKVSVFVWRLLRNRLPTKDNLLREGSFIMMILIMWEGAVLWSLLSILFFIVSFLETCGTIYFNGLVFLLLHQPRFRITFIILGIWWGYRDPHILFLKLSGMLVFGLFGRNK